MRVLLEDVTRAHLQGADVILVVDPTQPDCPEQLWGERNLPAVTTWPAEPYSLEVLEIVMDSRNRGKVHQLREDLKTAKGWPRPPRTETPAGHLAAGAIRLVNDRVPAALMEQFCRLFERAWAIMPPDIQSEVAGYWWGTVAPECCRAKRNVRDRYDAQVSVGPEWGVPKANEDGHVLYFPIPSLLDMGERLAILAIAHELAHVTYYATGEPNHWPDARNPYAYAEAERLVDERLLSWGAEQEQLQRLDGWLEHRNFRRT